MKKFLLILLTITVTNYAQSVSITNIQQITNKEQGSFHYPQFNHNGTKILFTSAGYQGLWLYDLNTQSILKINDHPGAGYYPVFTTDDSHIVFRIDQFKQGKRSSSMRKYDIALQEESIIVDFTRELSAPIKANNSEVVYLKNYTPAVFSIDENKRIENSSLEANMVFIENTNLMLYQNGSKKILNPLGEGSYIWASLSPNKSKILFRVAGINTYVTELNGNIITELGYANAPVWSHDGNWIAYMADRDDGEVVTSSDIFVASLDGSINLNLTNNPSLKGMYPQWSSDGRRIVFSTFDGIIYIINLTLE